MAMRAFFLICSGALLLTGAGPVLAQQKSDGYALIEAVKKDDASAALQLLRDNPTLVDTRDENGDTPLMIALRRNNRAWTGQFLNSGANVELAAKNGDTPIILAARVGMEDAIGWMIRLGVKIDSANKMGETALIIVVLGRNLRLVRLLLAAGANPDKSDYSGHSARDYAARDNRSRQMSEMIEKAKPKG